MRILLAEDDVVLAERIRIALEAAGFVVGHFQQGEEAEEAGHIDEYQAAILDLGLPGMDGLSILERWRRAGILMPVLVLTARSRWHDKLAGFDAGADDFLTKPFLEEELILRLRALIRRSIGLAHPCLVCGDLRLDSNTGRLELAGVPLRLTAQEFRILSYFMHNAERVISRSKLADHVYEVGLDPESNTLDVLIGRIRRKVGAEMIQTLRGQGYMLTANP